ncbi:MAG: hypothetical protein RML12_05960 [Xanthomonadales bacterium]|nr:hypothetical protein [Xanthomonadales bacterium]
MALRPVGFRTPAAILLLLLAAAALAADPATGHPRSGIDAADGDDRRIAACSRAFLDCASGGRSAMDRCVATIPPCPAHGRPCCPRPCLDRYRRLRDAGLAHPRAVRDALFPEPGSSCADRR